MTSVQLNPTPPPVNGVLGSSQVSGDEPSAQAAFALGYCYNLLCEGKSVTEAETMLAAFYGTGTGTPIGALIVDAALILTETSGDPAADFKAWYSNTDPTKGDTPIPTILAWLSSPGSFQLSEMGYDTAPLLTEFMGSLSVAANGQFASTLETFMSQGSQGEVTFSEELAMYDDMYLKSSVKAPYLHFSDEASFLASLPSGSQKVTPSYYQFLSKVALLNPSAKPDPDLMQDLMDLMGHFNVVPPSGADSSQAVPPPAAADLLEQAGEDRRKGSNKA